ncbi:MAG: type II toxin-antitoxin system PemK/MazF family toxin [Chloroflexi bacterium]|nr:type II toxin-antitoxin system PemK/MazF family toxin [Chloroflexota bacterium]
MNQGDIWWADLPDPRGAEPGFRRPVIIVQQSPINYSQISTVICVPLTGNIRLANALGNVFMPAAQTKLPKDSVANVSQILTLDKRFLSDYVGAAPASLLVQVLDGVLFVLGR